MPSAPPSRAVAPATVDRRTVLAALAAGALAALLPGCGGGSDPGPDQLADAPFWQVIAERARAREPGLDGAAARRELGPALEAGAVTGPVPDAVARRLADDFRQGRTTVVDGWLLSRTEVLLAVLASEA